EYSMDRQDCPEAIVPPEALPTEPSPADQPESGNQVIAPERQLPVVPPYPYMVPPPAEPPKSNQQAYMPEYQAFAAPPYIPASYRYCIGCGAVVPSEYGFCGNCGRIINMPAPAVRMRDKKKIIRGVIIANAAIFMVILIIFGVWAYQNWRVPDVVGKTKQEAVDILTDCGIVYVLKTGTYTDDYDVGVIYEQNESGFRFFRDREKTVDLIVSRWKWVIMPEVSGKTLEEAEQLLADIGFGCRTINEYSDHIENGSVITADKTAGNKEAPGSVITLTVSKGTALDIPDIKNMPEEQAVTLLEDMGFNVKVNRAYNQLIPKGSAVSCRETRAAAGETVTVMVSKGPSAVVPDVIDTKIEDARPKLENLGLKVTVKYEYIDYAEENIVYEQSSSGEVDAGSEVILYVGKRSMEIQWFDWEVEWDNEILVKCKLKNISDKTITRIDTRIFYYDKNGEAVYNVDDMGSYCFNHIYYDETLRTGSSSGERHCYTKFYSKIVSAIKIGEVAVTFSDGETQIFSYGQYWHMNDYVGGFLY
ncbi:MAG: PASTA domain-containing protein, partial [Oscillospiraceae bacterium]|nr:PASTA domain-containing protein [Oscillospiraceae bacterium]